MNVVIYARQSSGVNENSASIEQQIESCQRLASEKGFTVLAVYQDCNISGKTYPATAKAEQIAAMDAIYNNWFNSSSASENKKFRQQCGAMLDFINQNKVDFVVCYDQTRLARPLTGSFLAGFLQQELGTAKIYTVKEGLIDLSNFAHSLVSSITSQINDNQIAITKQKAMAAIRKLKDSGAFVQGNI